MIILFGSNNKHKALEIKQIVKKHYPGRFQIKTLSEVLTIVIDVIEDGLTLEENAYKKASEYYRLTGIPCFADDTGLEIDALNGEPGVNSARYSGEQLNEQENRKKILDLMKNIQVDKRSARFRTVVCFFDGSNSNYIEGICKGGIVNEERGDHGFGYDSIFMPDGYQKTFAEMNDDEKNDISHRGKAIRNFVEFLKKLEA